jgi:multiple sugar transport system permease protein
LARSATIKKKHDFTPLIMLAPATIIIVVIIVYPIINAVKMSFQYYVMSDYVNIHYVFFHNYIKAWKDPAFLISIGNSVRWILVTVTAQLLIGLVLALLLNQKFRGRSLVRTICLIPWLTPGVVIALMWSWIYNGNFGVLNDLLMRLGIISNNVAWLANAKTALNAQIVAMIWQGIPFFMLMLLAAMQTIPTDLYEVAEVSGANGWQKFRYVTFPFLVPTLLMTSLLRIIWVGGNVDVIYLMTGGGPGFSSMTLSVYSYIEAQKSMNFGYGSTLAVYGTLFMLVLMVFYVRLMSRNRGEESPNGKK